MNLDTRQFDQGDSSQVAKNLGKAVEILKECGADGWVEMYEGELAALRLWIVILYPDYYQLRL